MHDIDWFEREGIQNLGSQLEFNIPSTLITSGREVIKRRESVKVGGVNVVGDGRDERRTDAAGTESDKVKVVEPYVVTDLSDVSEAETFGGLVFAQREHHVDGLLRDESGN